MSSFDKTVSIAAFMLAANISKHAGASDFCLNLTVAVLTTYFSKGIGWSIHIPTGCKNQMEGCSNESAISDINSLQSSHLVSLAAI